MTEQTLRLDFAQLTEAVPDHGIMQLEDSTGEFAAVKTMAANGEPSLFKAATLIVPMYLPFWDYEVTVEDCEAMERNFDAADPPPILLNHDWDADGIQGHIRAARWDSLGQRFRILMEFLGADACTFVQDRRWRKISGGFRLVRDDQGAPVHSKFSFFEVSVTPFPMVGQAKIDMEVKTMSNPVTPPPPKDEGKKEEQTVAAQAQTPAPATAAETVQAQSLPDISSHPLFLAMQAQNAQAIARVEAIEAERKAEKLTARKKADEADLLALVCEGFSLPETELQTKEAAFMASLSDEQKPAYIALRRSLPKAWPSGGRQAEVKLQTPGQDPQTTIEAQLSAIGAQFEPQKKEG